VLKKRLIGVITVKNGKAVQSFNYDNYLPLGSAECLAENLDRWGVDEIFIQVIDRTNRKIGPDFRLIEKIASLRLSTPLIYGGGINNVDDGLKVIQLGADRVVIDSLLHHNPSVIEDLSNQIGSQALVAAMPISFVDKTLMWMNYETRISKILDKNILKFLESGFFSEVMIINWKGEGVSDSFDEKFISDFPIQKISMIPFGGVDDINKISSLLTIPSISAFAIGNFLNYTEHNVQLYKNKVKELEILRKPSYQAEFKFYE
jgi:imidazole glycerol-phosphate synthase subunit HisF